MIKDGSLKQKYEKIHKNFNLKDLIGFSSLIFGLLLSNASINKASTPDHREPVVEKSQQRKEQNKKEKVVKKRRTSSKRKTKRKKMVKNTKKQTITASNKN